ncbi:MAG: hypothetical protein U9N45_05175, partial [Gemmatimonadota bacterium]|nr:hypothetical protein [Gemmatimonadota bacterium]
MKLTILEDIPLDLSLERLLARGPGLDSSVLHHSGADIESLLETACRLGRPRVLYACAEVENKGEN